MPIHIGMLERRVREHGDALLAPGELSREAGIAESTLASWRSAGTGPPWLRLQGSIYYSLAAFLAWIGKLPRNDTKGSGHPKVTMSDRETVRPPAQRALIWDGQPGFWNWKPTAQDRFTKLVPGEPIRATFQIPRDVVKEWVSAGLAHWETQEEADRRVYEPDIRYAIA